MPTNPVEGGKCLPGTFCPGRSEAPTNCTEGYYCATERLGSPTDQCNQGYYCTGGATTHSPTDGVTGDICPMGYYCPRGSVTGIPCPIGYYLNTTGSSVVSSCIICNKGESVML